MICFSKAGYGDLLAQFTVRGYRFAQFRELKGRSDQSPKWCLLRHDVDASLEYALEMAQKEKTLDVRATYFVMLRSPLYNLFSRHSARILRELIRLGHEVGLHFDAAGARGPERSLAQWVQFELSTLEVLAGTPVSAFSLHQPTQNVIAERLEIPGIVNTYHTEHMKGFHYISDSNRCWRDQDPIQQLEINHGPIHLLLHPMWWMCESSDIHECWDSAIMRNFEGMQEQLLDTERAYGGKRTIILNRQ